MTNNFPNTDNIRLKILKLLHNAKASHLGSGMSVVEILIAIYSSVDIDKIKNNSPDRSRVFVSKGHCACATYSVMNSFGLIDDETLSTYHSNDSLLAGHVSHSVECVEHSTGALGHGVSVALGAAIGMKSKNFKDNPISFCLCGDGEIQEGSVWEAFMLAGHLMLNNFVVLIDYNKISSITDTNKVVNLEPLNEKFSSFGFSSVEVDGHDINSIYEKIITRDKNKPLALICHTVKGKGVSFAENDPIWHYRTLTDELYAQAVDELKK